MYRSLTHPAPRSLTLSLWHKFFLFSVFVYVHVLCSSLSDLFRHLDIKKYSFYVVIFLLRIYIRRPLAKDLLRVSTYRPSISALDSVVVLIIDLVSQK